MRSPACRKEINNLDSKPVGFLYFLLFLFLFTSCKAQPGAKKLLVGAAQTERYLPMLKGKKVGVIANPTSVVGKVHLIDTLLSLKVNIGCVFAPEHGFRGEAEAGESIQAGIDQKTGVKIFSLYGDQKKPTDESLNGIDVLIFDIQDVGARFYTYINTLQYVMEAAAKHHIPLLVFDRPNPHGNYIDGPVLDTVERSFVGLQQIPIVHGMTVGEYATMLNGQFWLQDSVQCDLQVIQMLHWDRNQFYNPPIPPSPNLPNRNAVYLYPSLCLFEGTAISLGRGTELPFQCYGFPGNPRGDFEFTPRSIPGKSKHPLYEDKLCKGFNVTTAVTLLPPTKLELKWLIDAWYAYPDKSTFFLPFFDKLAGNHVIKQQISADWSEEKIRASWAKDLAKFAAMRAKYLMY